MQGPSLTPGSIFQAIFILFRSLSIAPGRAVHPHCRQFINFTEEYDGDKFFTVLEGNVKRATPLLLVLAVIEISDVVFAVDSIPAVNKYISPFSSCSLSAFPEAMPLIFVFAQRLMHFSGQYLSCARYPALADLGDAIFACLEARLPNTYCSLLTGTVLINLGHLSSDYPRTS